MENPLRTFLTQLALEPDRLAWMLSDPEAAMAQAGLGNRDRELLRSGDQDRLLARLSMDRGDGAEPGSRHDGAASRGTLVVAGTGIRAVGQLTIEAIARIRHADRVFYLVAEPVAEEVIRSLNPAASCSLAPLYQAGKPRRDTYREMVERILASVRAGWRTCAVFYGHPGVFVDPAHRAIRLARQEGFQAEMLAGVSAEDCLFADLGIDPAASGCQSYEATDFLVNRRQLDPTGAVVLWQAGGLGDRTFRVSVPDSSAIDLLRERLGETYPREHELCVYEAAVLPGCTATVRWLPLGRMDRTHLSIVSTLYIPPSQPPRVDLAMYFSLTG